MDGGVTRSLYIGRDKTLEVLKRKEAVEKELKAKREAKIREQHDRMERAAQLKEAELRDRARLKQQRELERQKAVLDRRCAQMEQLNARKMELLKRTHHGSSRIVTLNQAKKPIYAFGSSTPRKLAFLENIQQQQRDSGGSRNSPMGMRGSTPSLAQGPSNTAPTTSRFQNPLSLDGRAGGSSIMTRSVVGALGNGIGTTPNKKNYVNKPPVQPTKQTPNSIKKQRKMANQGMIKSNEGMLTAGQNITKEVQQEKQNSPTQTATNKINEGMLAADQNIINEVQSNEGMMTSDQNTTSEVQEEKQNSPTLTATNTSFYTAHESSSIGEVSMFEHVPLTESEPIITPPKSTTPPVLIVIPNQEEKEERRRHIKELLARTRQEANGPPNAQNNGITNVNGGSSVAPSTTPSLPISATNPLLPQRDASALVQDINAKYLHKFQKQQQKDGEMAANSQANPRNSTTNLSKELDESGIADKEGTFCLPGEIISATTQFSNVASLTIFSKNEEERDERILLKQHPSPPDDPLINNGNEINGKEFHPPEPTTNAQMS
ncbi:hypothetical protein niasHT_008049 [Heterodera trifolii]|uniref:Uncharacterized protein n=1 Tax=Heterodera trifolii TaxID=157864 RepID=A0ABD2LZS3_9BILA